MIKILLVWLILVTSVVGKDFNKEGLPNPPDPNPIPISSVAKEILQQHCFECHGTKRESDPNYDVSNWKYLVSSKTRLVVPGEPDKSRIIKRITSNPVEMPPETRKPLNKEEIKILTDWIKDGAKPWSKEVRSIIDPKYVSIMIGTDYRQFKSESTNFRYLSLVNLYEDGASEEEIVHTQESVSKVMNFLAHGKAECVPTTVLDELGLVVRIDLRDYGWSNEDWNAVKRKYPYGDPTSFMRADWFCINVSQPPLYYQLRRIPLTESEFEKQLGIKKGTLIRRAGVTDSQVAVHPRLFNRYETDNGYYWKTLNIKDGNTSSVLDHDKFKSDYSVSLYSLQNNLLGFAVFEKDENNDKVFNRVDEVDIDAEFDPTKVVGTPHSTPMLSCITCHVTGIMPNIRDVTDGTAINFLQADKEAYLKAIKQTGPSMEPLRTVADRYNRPVDLERASQDVGMNPDQFGGLIRNQKEFKILSPLLGGRTVTRKTLQNVLTKRVAQQKER